MTPASSSFTPLNIPNDCVPEWLDSFTLAAPPNTDLWRKPPTEDTSTAPILYTALRAPFIAAEVRVSADWELEWDQGGLVIFAGTPPRQATATAAATTTTTTTTTTTAIEAPNVANILLEDNATQSPAPSLSQTSPSDHVERLQDMVAERPVQESGTGGAQLERGPPPPYAPPAPASKWVKVGLEFRNNVCHATSVVANCEGADWSLSALAPHQQRRYDLRVKMERIGYALWVWYEDEMLGWTKLREVTWFFWGVDHKAVRVGVYASRPANFEVNLFDQNHGRGNHFRARNLCVDFDGLEIY